MTEVIWLYVIGGLLIAISIACFIWYKTSLDAYYEKIVNRYDLREFLERKPHIPWPETVFVLSSILLAIGIALIVIGLVVSLT